MLVAAAFFGAVAPTLTWLEFVGGSEVLVVETALEMRRGGPWFIPTLQGYPRLTKPPLTAWLTAAAARPDTVAKLTTRDPAVRHAAFDDFAWEVRWPTLLSACAMLAATFALGELLFGRPVGGPVGLVAALACGSSLLFLRFCRAATTDVQLALWVAVANAFLALAVLRGRYWAGFLGAGVALGLANMSKGPVGLVQSVVPFAAFVLWRRWARRATPTDPESQRGRPWAAAIIGLVGMLAIALPWPLVVVAKYPDIWAPWWKEITREGATQLAPDPWYYYFVFPFWIVPWLAFGVAGAWLAGAALLGRGGAGEEELSRREGFVLALLLTVVPIVVMSVAKDKTERYTLPMAPAACVLAAGALVAWYRSGRHDPAGRVVEIVHWATLVGLAVGLPVMGSVPWLAEKLGLGAPWFTPGRAAVIGAATLGVIAAGAWLTRRVGRRRGACAAAVVLAVTAAAVMLLLQYPFVRGYSRVSVSDLRPLAEVVWAQCPDAALYEYDPGTRTRTYLDLPIYAGRVSRKVRDLAALPPEGRPQVVVFFDRRREGHEAPPPPPWRELASGGGKKNRWKAYLRER